MICLIRPPATETFRFSTLSVTPPLGLAYIAGALRAAGEDVEVIDAVAQGPEVRTRYIKGFLVGLPLEEIARRIPPAARAVGVSVIFTHEWPMAVRLIDLIKRARPDIPVVLGGEHVTSLPEFCLRTSRADVAVLGEGEETVVELVRALDSGRSLQEVVGIAFREDERIVGNPRRAATRDVDAIAWPAWDLFDLETYRRHGFVGGQDTGDVSVPILATRGCPYQCTFCSAPNTWLPRWVPRTPARVVDEIEHYVRTYGARNFPFQDLTAVVRKEWMVEFCEEIMRRDLDIRWQLPSGTRSEAIDLEVARLLKRSGMISLAYAPESGSETTRRLIKKKMNGERLLASVRAAVESELNVALFVIFGFPHDTREEVLTNVAFLREMAAEGVTDVSVGFYMALPGSELFYSLADAGKVRLDRDYFRHILQGLELWPTTSYCDSLGRIEQTLLKLRLFLAFYGARNRRVDGRVPMATAFVRGVRGVGKGAHRSKLETAVRNALRNLSHLVAVRFRPGWIGRAEERRMFDGWDEIHQAIREAKRAEGRLVRLPADTRELHTRNVVQVLRLDHGRAGSVPA